MATRPSWTAITVTTGQQILSGDARIVAFFRWLRREALEEGTIFTDPTGEHVTNPLSVHWGTFPLQRAVDAAAVAEVARAAARLL
jgi:hypothetical protein